MSETQARPNAIIMVLCGMLTALVVIAFARLAFGLILPSMRADLGLSYQQAGLLATVTALAYLAFVLSGGVAAARWGARFTVVFGLASVAVGFAGLSVASAYPLLMVLMGLLGFGTAFSFAPMVSLLATWYPERRGLVIGCMTGGIGAGALSAGLLVPWLFGLFDQSGWRVAWGVFSATASAACLLVLLFVRDPPVDPPGVHTRPPSADKWLIYLHPRMLTLAGVYGIIGLTYIVQAVFMVSFMVESGYSEATAGRLLAMMGMLSIVAGPLWGSLSDRLGRGNALTAAMAVVTIAMTLPLVHQSLPMFFLHFLLMGCSVNGMFTLVQATSTDQVPPRYIPIAFSFVTLFFAGGQFVGPAFAGWLIETTGDFRFAFGFTASGLAAGVYLTLRIRHFPREWLIDEAERTPDAIETRAE